MRRPLLPVAPNRKSLMVQTLCEIVSDNKAVDDTHLGIAIGIECSIMSNTAFVKSSHPRR